MFFQTKNKQSAQSHLISCEIEGDLEDFFCYVEGKNVFEKTATRRSRFNILARRARFLKY